MRANKINSGNTKISGTEMITILFLIGFVIALYIKVLFY